MICSKFPTLLTSFGLLRDTLTLREQLLQVTRNHLSLLQSSCRSNRLWSSRGPPATSVSRQHLLPSYRNAALLEWLIPFLCCLLNGLWWDKDSVIDSKHLEGSPHISLDAACTFSKPRLTAQSGPLSKKPQRHHENYLLPNTQGGHGPETMPATDSNIDDSLLLMLDIFANSLHYTKHSYKSK